MLYEVITFYAAEVSDVHALRIVCQQAIDRALPDLRLELWWRGRGKHERAVGVVEFAVGDTEGIAGKKTTTPRNNFV